MKRYCFIGLCLLVLMATSASATVLIGQSVNNGGLTDLTTWTFYGPGNTAALDNNRPSPDGHDWNVGSSDGSGSSPAYSDFYYQSFAVAPGLYNISFSGWSKAYAGWWAGEDWQWIQEAHVELYVDSVLVYDGLSSNNTNRDTWAQHTFSGQIQVNSTIEAALHTVKGNDQSGSGTHGAIWFSSRYDDVSLTATAVPEPSSLLALVSGVAALGGLFLRKR